MVLLLCLILAVMCFAGWALFNVSGALSLALLTVSLGAIALEGARRRRKVEEDREVAEPVHAKYRIVGLGIVLHDDPPRGRR